MKQRIEGLKAVHVYLSKYSPRALGPIDEASLRVGAARHPSAGAHASATTAARRCISIRCGWNPSSGMQDKDALALIDELMQHATQQKYEYRHQWRQGDMVIWDNRSVMHQANPDYDMAERRYLYRLMLQGATLV